MAYFFPHRFPALLLLGAVLVLPGCARKIDAPAEALQNAAMPDSEQQAALQPVAGQAAALDYLQLALPHLAATYEGQCLTLPDNLPAAGPLQLAASGKLSLGEASSDLARANFMIARVADDSIRAGYTVSLSRGEQALMLQPVAEQDGSLSASVKNGEATVGCTVTAKALPLNGKTLYSVFASVLDAPARNIGCMTAKGNATFDIALAKGMFRLGDHTVDLNQVAHEMAAVVDDSNQFTYLAKPSYDQELTISLDRNGKLSNVTLQAPGIVASCADLNKQASN